MEIQFTKELLRRLRSIKTRQPRLYKKIAKQLKLFSQDPKHPSLRVHKLKGRLEDTWSISIDESTRMLYSLFDNTALFFQIGTHDQVYKK